MNKKINTSLEFPHELDLKEYTLNHLDSAQNDTSDDESFNKYKLKGITVHQGTAELGHYFSYINYKDDKWLEFNDSNIREFNPQNIEAECFGGTSSQSSDNYWEKGENSKNAYILVYERIAKTPLKFVTESQEQKEELEKSLSITINTKEDNKKESGQQPQQELLGEIDYNSI